MMQRLKESWLAGSLFAVVVVVLTARAAPARADAVAECIGASERSLDLRKQGKLLEARREVAACTASICPEVIQEACVKRMSEINGAVPSVVLDVRDGAGRSVAGARVSIDAGVATPVGVTAVPMDPGSHTLRFLVDGLAPIEKSVVLLEGEKEKRIPVVMGPTADDTHLARLVVSSDESATVAVDEKAAARGRYDDQLPAGSHDIEVTEAGKVTFKAQVDLREGETRSLSVALEDEKRAGPVWPWIAGGVAVAAGAVLGGYFLFKPQDQTNGVPAGKTATLQLSLSGR
jgi:hypothetical protein